MYLENRVEQLEAELKDFRERGLAREKRIADLEGQVARLAAKINPGLGLIGGIGIAPMQGIAPQYPLPGSAGDVPKAHGPTLGLSAVMQGRSEIVKNHDRLAFAVVSALISNSMIHGQSRTEPAIRDMPEVHAVVLKSIKEHS